MIKNCWRRVYKQRHIWELGGLGSINLRPDPGPIGCLWCLCKRTQVHRERDLVMLTNATIAMEDGQSPRICLAAAKQ